MTEQGTRYEISDGECRRVARHGPIYNPYRERAQAVASAHQDAAGYGAIGIGGKSQPAP